MPKSLKFVIAICWLQLATSVFFFGVAFWICAAGPPESGFWLGFDLAMVRAFSSASNVTSFGPEQFGEATFKICVMALFPSACLICIRRRRHKALIWWLIIGVIISVAGKGIPFVSIVALILSLRSGVAVYLSEGRDPQVQSSSETKQEMPCEIGPTRANYRYRSTNGAICGPDSRGKLIAFRRMGVIDDHTPVESSSKPDEWHPFAKHPDFRPDSRPDQDLEARE